MSRRFILNPDTNRYIEVGNKTYNNLKADGVRLGRSITEAQKNKKIADKKSGKKGSSTKKRTSSSKRKSFPKSVNCKDEIPKDRVRKYIVNTNNPSGRTTVLKADSETGCDQAGPFMTKAEAKKLAGVGVKRFPKSASCKGEIPKERRRKYLVNTSNPSGRFTVVKADGKVGCDLPGPFMTKKQAEKRVRELNEVKRERKKQPIGLAVSDFQGGEIIIQRTDIFPDDSGLLSEEEVVDEILREGKVIDFNEDGSIEVEADIDNDGEPEQVLITDEAIQKSIEFGGVEEALKEGELELVGSDVGGDDDVDQIIIASRGELEVDDRTIMQIIRESEIHTTFVRLLDRSGLGKSLDDRGRSILVFAPHNDALSALSVQNLSDNELKIFVASHLTNDTFPQGDEVKTIKLEDETEVQIDRNGVFGINFTCELVPAYNGEVICIEEAIETQDFSAFEAEMEEEGFFE